METRISDEIIEIIDGESSCFASLNQDMELDEEENEIYTDYILIDKLYVSTAQRRQGLGRKLLQACVKAIRENFAGLPIKLAALPDDETIISQASLVAFYESEGFYVDDNGDGDAVIMAL